MMRKALLWGAAAAIAFGSSAGVANVVVVKSLGPSAKAYPPGRTLSESAKINLQGGDVVTVLGPASAQTLRGPGNFDAKQVALASAAGQRGRFGALRASEVAHNPSIWDVDVSQSGKICVSDTSKVQLWRPDSEIAATVQIHSADGASQDLSWAAGSALTAWPAALPPARLIHQRSTIALGSSAGAATPEARTTNRTRGIMRMLSAPGWRDGP